MRSLLLIMRREIQERVQTRSFRLFTAGLFLLVLGGIVAIDRAPEIFGDTSITLGIPADAPPELVAAIEQFASIADREVDLTRYGAEPEAASLLDEGEVDAYLAGNRLIFDSDEIPGLTAIVTNATYDYELRQGLEALGISEEQQRELLTPTAVDVVVQDEGTTGRAGRQFIGFVAALALYVTIALYGNWILTGIVEEKSSRVIEVLLGLVRPAEMLAGKTLGILVVAVLQLVAALGAAALGLVLTGTDALPAVALDVVLAAVPLFIMGLLLYSLLYAAAGATVSRQADAQTASTPIAMMLLVPYMYAAIFVPENPDGVAATFLSIFPFTSPLVMPARVASGTPSAPELVACFALLVPAIMLVAFIGGRIYASVILSGRKFSFGTLMSLVVRPGNMN